MADEVKPVEPVVTIDYKQLADNLIASFKAPSGTPTNVDAHGTGGLFSPFGLSKDIVNAMLMPGTGLINRLPVETSNEENPLLGILTGLTASSGSEASNRCDDPPSAGLLKLCTHSYVWGWFGRTSSEMRLDQFGQIVNRGEFMDHQLIGDPFGGPDVQNTSALIPGGTADFLRAGYKKAMYEVAGALLRDQAADIFTGAPANNTGEGRQYYRGLDTLINTGYVDAITQVACPAADSIVSSFASAAVETNGGTLVSRIANIMRRLNIISAMMGMAPTRWVIVMRPALFYQITEVWPCAYSTYRCFASGDFNTSNPSFTNTGDLIKMRDEMRGDLYQRTGQYLLIDGVKVEVVLDDGIAETNLAGSSFTSDMYFVPMVSRGRAVTRMQYFNFDGPYAAMQAAQALGYTANYATTGAGRYLWHSQPPKNLCVKVVGWTKPRLILETPYLAARLTNLKYTPVAHERDWNPSNTSFFADGGRTTYAGYGSFYTP